MSPEARPTMEGRGEQEPPTAPEANLRPTPSSQAETETTSPRRRQGSRAPDVMTTPSRRANTASGQWSSNTVDMTRLVDEMDPSLIEDDSDSQESDSGVVHEPGPTSRQRYPPRHSSYNAPFTSRAGGPEGMQTLLDFLRQSSISEQQHSSGADRYAYQYGSNGFEGHGNDRVEAGEGGSTSSNRQRRSTTNASALRRRPEASTSTNDEAHGNTSSTLGVSHAMFGTSLPSQSIPQYPRNTEQGTQPGATLYSPFALHGSSAAPLRRDGQPGSHTVQTAQRQAVLRVASSSHTQRPTSSGSSNTRPFVPARPGPNSPIVLPPWQPDDDVTHCFVCSTKFTFFYRKHHCRKCGRVVCSNCSPHRITIPRPFIVQPPEESDAMDPDEQRRASIQALLAFSESMNNASSDRYRNGAASNLPGPSQNPRASALSGGETVRVCNPCVPDPNFDPPPPYPGLPPNHAASRARSSYNSGVTSGAPSTHSGSANERLAAEFRLQQARAEIARNRPFRASGQEASTSSTRHSAAPMPVSGPSSAGVRTSVPISATSAPAPRAPIREEDECPVCGRELPPSDEARVAHVNACLMAGSQSSPGAGSAMASRGLLAFTATEKDCLNGEGQPAECEICFEEYVVGERLARLVCLCRFHVGCVEGWWRVGDRSRGDCPTHSHRAI